MNQQYVQHNQGFTIVELLVVIVVIGILAAITVVAYNGVQNRAQAAAIVSGIQSVDKGLHLYAASQGDEKWWNDRYFTTANNPTVSDMIAAGGLKNYLQQAPTTPGVASGWYYDNDDDVRDPAVCDLVWNGASLGIPLPTKAVAQAVDDQLDDGKLNCGRVRYTGNNIIYQLGFTQELK